MKKYLVTGYDINQEDFDTYDEALAYLDEVRIDWNTGYYVADEFYIYKLHETHTVVPDESAYNDYVKDCIAEGEEPTIEGFSKIERKYV